MRCDRLWLVTCRKQRIVVVREGVPIGVVALADLAAHDRYENVGRACHKIVAID